MMESSSSEVPEENQFFTSNSLDSGFSEDMKTSPENTQFSSGVNQEEPKNNLDLLQSSIRTIERNIKKRKPEESEPGTSGISTSKEFSDKMFILHKLRNKEKQMKTAIAYEKIRKEQPVILNKDILLKKIAECQRLVEEARHEHKMRTVFCTNLQLENTFQRIVGKTEATQKAHKFSELKRECMKILFKRNKVLMKRIRTKQKELAKIDEEILSLREGKTLIANKQIKSTPMTNSEPSYASIEVNKLEELQQLQQNNEKVKKRIHHLSGIIQSLVPYIGSKWQEESKLAELMAECEKVSNCHFDKVDEINTLLRSMCLVNL